MNLFSRSPLLLHSYLATEMLAPFFASFLVMNGVFSLVKLIPFLNFSLDLGIGFADLIRLFSYMLPNMLLYTLPMAAMMGIIICFSRLSNDTEILALKAGGISVFQLLPSVIAVSIVIALISAYVSVTLIAQSQFAMKQMTYQLLKEKIDRGIKEAQFTEALGELVVHVGEIDPASGEWKDVWVSDMRGQKTPSITLASSGRMTSDISRMNVTILLRNGSLHRPDGTDAQIVNFERYIIDIPLQLPAQAKVKEYNLRNLPELLAAAERYGLDNEHGRDLLVEFHKRLVLPVGCLIMSLLALPLGLLAGPGKKAIGIPLGLATFIVYYMLYSTFKNLAEDGVAPIMILMWLPNIIFLIAAIYSIRRTALELPIISENLQERCSRLYAATLRSPLRKSGQHWLEFRRTVLSPLLSSFRSSSAEHGQTAVTADPASNLFHLSHCVHQHSSTCTVRFESAEEAVESGFTACAECHPGQTLQGKKSKQPAAGR